MSFKFQIASTYRRDVTVTIPGPDTDKPQEVQIVAIFNDVDPADIDTEKRKLAKALDVILDVIRGLRGKAKPDEAKLDAAEEAIEEAKSAETTIDQVLAGIEIPKGSEVLDKHGAQLSDDALLDFAKRYPRWRDPIMKKWDEENGSESTDPAHLGNLLASAGLGRR